MLVLTGEAELTFTAEGGSHLQISFAMWIHLCSS